MWSETFRAIRRMLGLMERPYVPLSILAVCLVVHALLPVGTAYANKLTLDGITLKSLPVFHKGIISALIVSLTSALNAGFAMYLRVNVVERLSRHMRDGLVSSVLAMPLLESEKRPRGDLASRLTADIATGARIFTNLYFLSGIILRAVSALIYMLVLNWRVGLLCGAAGPLLITVGGFLARSVSKSSARFQEDLGRLSGDALNFLEGASVVKAFNAEELVEESFGRTVQKARHSGLKLGLLTSALAGWTVFGSILPFVIAAVYGGSAALSGELTLGGILAIIVLCNNLAWPLNQIGTYIGEIARCQGAIKRVIEIIDEAPESDPALAAGVPETGMVSTATCPIPAIKVSHLCFDYGGSRQVLKDVSFEVRQGDFVAIVGRSGCGKSTLLKILAGLYRPSPGTVFVFGRDAHYEAVSFVRKKVAYMPQESFIYPGTIEENLRLGKEDASQDDIAIAVELARFGGVVRESPGGLSTLVGEGGRTLSGGERQRLAMARTILRDAEILLLDEPTSSVDRESESLIWDALRNLMAGKTTILVTHRLDIASKADLIIVMDSGSVAESGTHDELTRYGSLYPALYAGQLPE
ncbi:MAG TPA: ABC transporter ATP-binding protein [Firmicutes bacterium]|nr:ABC transporter ATP-binding protein [Candidatus Fermentithermobacillaceae bacterium]